MTQMESPKRKMQKKNDYQRYKLFRKIKRRRKAQAKADQHIAEKQFRKKLKLPKFDRGEDELSIYKKQVEMFNDANSDPTLPGRLVDRNRITVNPETGDVIETGGHVNLDPVIITGKMPDNLKRTINKNIESNRLQDLLYKDRLSPVDPIGELVVESAAIGKPLELAGKAALYGIGRYGGKFGLKKLQGLARQKLLEKEFAISNGRHTIGKDHLNIGSCIGEGGESFVYNTAGDPNTVTKSDSIEDYEGLQRAVSTEYQQNKLPFFFKQDYLGYTDKNSIPSKAGKTFGDEQFRIVTKQPKVIPFSKVADPWFTLTENDGRQGIFRYFDKDKIYNYLRKYGVEKTKDPYIYKYKNITFSDIRPQNAGIDKNGNFGFLDLIIHDYNSGKDVSIKPSKRGTFTKAAKQHSMSVQGFANRVLRNPSKYSAAMRKKANFAHNAAGWKH